MCRDKRTASVFLIIVIEITIRSRRETGIGTDNKFRQIKFFHHFFLQRNHGILFTFVAGGNTKSDGNAIHIHEQPHLYNRQRAVLLAGSILFVILCLFNFKVKVCTVIIDHPGLSLIQICAVLEKAALYIIRFFCNNRKSPVNIMKFKRWFFNKTFGIFKTAFFRRRKKNPCINQAGKDIV